MISAAAIAAALPLLTPKERAEIDRLLIANEVQAVNHTLPDDPGKLIDPETWSHWSKK